ncbi:MAG: hypothetical protein AAFU49_07050 [Pseudomonadota bacterium]
MAFKSEKLKELNDQIAFGDRSSRRQLADGLKQVERLMRELRAAMRQASKIRTQIKRTSQHLGKDLYLAGQLSKKMTGLEQEIATAEKARDTARGRELNRRVRRRDKDAAERLGNLSRRTKAVEDIEKDYGEIIKALKKLG